MLLFLLFHPPTISFTRNIKNGTSAIFSIQRSIDDFDSTALLSSYLTSEILSRERVFQFHPEAYKSRSSVFLSHNFSITSNPAFFFFFFSQLVFSLLNSNGRRVDPRNQLLCTVATTTTELFFLFSSYYTSFFCDRLSEGSKQFFHVFMWRDLRDN